MRAQGISEAELARRIGTSASAVRELADEYADVSARLFGDDPHLSVDPIDGDQ